MHYDISNPKVLYLRGKCYSALIDYENALNDFRTAKGVLQGSGSSEADMIERYIHETQTNIDNKAVGSGSSIPSKSGLNLQKSLSPSKSSTQLRTIKKMGTTQYQNKRGGFM